MFLYTVALGYPNTPTPQEKAAAKDFLLSLQHLIPCDKCRVNLRAKMNGEFGTRLDAALQCSETFTRYVYDLEASVAASTGKTLPSYSDTVKTLLSNTYVSKPAVAAGSAEASTTFASPTTSTSGVVLGVTLPLVAVALVIIT